MSIDDLVRMNGLASRRLLPAGRPCYGDMIRDFTQYEWLPAFGLAAISFDGKRIEMLKTYSPTLAAGNGGYKTKEGIGPQSSPAQVLRAYGKPAATKGNDIYRILIYDRIGLFIGLDQAGVFHIGIFRPGEVKRFWKF